MRRGLATGAVASGSLPVLSRLPGRVSAAALGSVLLLLSGCASPRPWLNEALAPDQKVEYDGRAQLVDTARMPDLLVVASFSGGGSRAAAFAHAVLAELDAEPFAWRGRVTTLAAEIDVVAGVSGGSVTAAHLALHGTQSHLLRFGDDFLATDFQGRVVSGILAPSNLVRSASPWHGRGHVLAEAFDEQLFGGATFAALAARPGRPYLMIGATDLSTGADFDFTSDQFGRLCSSIDDVPLAFAVAASSSVPLLFSPLTLQSHHGQCQADTDVSPDRPETAGDSARVRLVKAEFNALVSDDRRFIHLVDGGVADNLGTRRITDYVAQAGGVGAVLNLLGLGGDQGRATPPRVVFITVNSERQMTLAMDQSGEVPSTLEVANALVYGGLGRLSRETTLVFGDAVEQWRQELRANAGAGSDADVFAIEIKLADLQDAELRDKVLQIPTSFRISPEHLALLHTAARKALAASPEYQRFRQSVDAPVRDDALTQRPHLVP